jgi:hypothetical protein
MEKTWDNSLSILVNSNPQAFLDLFLPGATLCQQHHTKLKGTQRQPDVVLEVERRNAIFIYNPELQSYQDKNMAERPLLYHVLLGYEFRTPNDQPRPVRSCVVALFKQAKMKSSFLHWLRPGDWPWERVERLRLWQPSTIRGNWCASRSSSGMLKAWRKHVRFSCSGRNSA